MRIICAGVRIFHSEFMPSSEPSTAREPEEDSLDVHSDSDNEEVSQINFDSQTSPSAKIVFCEFFGKTRKTIVVIPLHGYDSAIASFPPNRFNTSKLYSSIPGYNT